MGAMRMTRRLCVLVLAFALSGCGGGGSVEETIEISPSSTTLSPGGMELFIATSTTGVHPIYFEWIAEGGSYTLGIDHSFIIYYAGDTPGDYTIRVQDERNRFTYGTASVTIAED